MHRLAKAIFIFLMTGNAQAAWTVVDSSVSPHLYVDAENVRRTGDVARIWTVLDYAAPQSTADRGGYSSIVILQEIHCTEGKTRAIQMSMYSGRMGAGTILLNRSFEGEWTYARPGTNFDKEAKIACAKRQ
jgi:hypothetical protein